MLRLLSGLKEYGEALLRFADLPKKPLRTESQAWTLLIDQLGLEEKEIRSFLKQWKCSNQMIKEVQLLVYGLKQRKQHFLEALDLYRLGRESALNVEELIGYFAETPELQQVAANYDKLPIKSLSELSIDGNLLLETSQKKPGKWVSEALQLAERGVITGAVANDKDELLVYLKEQNIGI